MPPSSRKTLLTGAPSIKPPLLPRNPAHGQPGSSTRPSSVAGPWSYGTTGPHPNCCKPSLSSSRLTPWLRFPVLPPSSLTAPPISACVTPAYRPPLCAPNSPLSLLLAASRRHIQNQAQILELGRRFPNRPLISYEFTVCVLPVGPRTCSCTGPFCVFRVFRGSGCLAVISVPSVCSCRNSDSFLLRSSAAGFGPSVAFC
jgi:hypothetical protein